MDISIANLSTIADDALAAALAAINLQVSRDFAPEWRAGGTLVAQRMAIAQGAKVAIDAPREAVIYIGTESQDPTAGAAALYGYHAQNHAHLPFGFVYLDVCAAYHEAWSVTLSHEVLELLADPTAILTVPAPSPVPPAAAGAAAPQVHYDLEVCDAVQGDTYQIAGVAVSNFVTRAYFGLPDGTLPATNFLKLPLAPFGVRPGGYAQYEDGAGAHQIDGARVTVSTRQGRALLAQFKRTGRRAHRRLGLA